MAPQPKESLEAIYEWVGDWDQTWAGIYSWWKYIDENKLSIPKVHDTNLRDMTEESAIWQNEVIPVAIAIADLQQPEGQRRFNIDDLFEDYQEWATSEEDKLADDVDDDEGNGEGEPGPSAKGPRVAGENEPCETCAQVNLTCVREPESSWRKQKNSSTVGEAGPSHKQVKPIMTMEAPPAEPATGPAKKLTLKILAQKQQPDPTPTCSPLPQLTPSPHDPSPTPCLFFHRATPTPRPSFKPSPAPVDEPGVSLPINKLQVESKPFFVTVTGLLEEPGDVEVLAWSDTPLATEIPEVEYPCEWSTANIVERL
ncbi:hypothetical protein M404DRAFT_34365 [Pisolithus tinctorius Marx 270]|uniref:Uncharacterized protein n=1 Tax=Pisolithus tinctorius Marx 270 TaxID=870435 RepID=A0A0C3NID7_PISTI|nr:hypothetical protein M404DRAFT_34365 [Pisolithus tinctorius Marx 270]